MERHGQRQRNDQDGKNRSSTRANNHPNNSMEAWSQSPMVNGNINGMAIITHGYHHCRRLKEA
jgi:glutamate mutase epsilon subunit